MVTSNKNIELPFSISNSVNHGKFPQKTPPRASAVCLLFRRDQSGHTHAILTKRSTQVSSHKGQISLPGGHYESSDENLEYTALRETEEELGIPIHSIEVQSHLPKIHGLDGRSIFPIVATTECSLEAINPSSDEVDKVLHVPWQCLTRANVDKFTFVMFGIRRMSYLFKFEEHNIWGITANILYRANITGCDPT